VDSLPLSDAGFHFTQAQRAADLDGGRDHGSHRPASQGPDSLATLPGYLRAGVDSAAPPQGGYERQASLSWY